LCCERWSVLWSSLGPRDAHLSEYLLHAEWYASTMVRLTLFALGLFGTLVACVTDDSVVRYVPVPVTKDAEAPDGSALADAGGNDVAVRDPDGGGCGSKPFGAPQRTPLFSALNTAVNETSLTLSADGLRMVVTVGIKLGYSTREKVSDSWSAPTMYAAPNYETADVYDGDPTLGPDETLYFLSRRTGEYRIHRAMKDVASGTWKTPALVETFSVGGFADERPWIRSDGQELSFASKRPTMPGGPSGVYHLWHALVTSMGMVKTPTATTLLNGASNDTAPVLSPKGLVIYFTSDRPGSNGFDVWRSERATLDSDWTPPTRVEAVASAQNDQAVWVSDDDCTLYLTSDRPGGSGGFDLWVSRRE
jgi:hypothetical protein